MTATATGRQPRSQPVWRQAVSRYAHSDERRSAWQIANTLIPYFGLFALMVLSLEVSYWLTLALAIPAAGFLVRIFIIFHDCGHGSFFESRKANDLLGVITGILTFTPYQRWRHDHAIHHATAGDLDRRDVGDVWTLTVAEYLEAPTWKRYAYRVYRNPLVMFGIGSWLSFIVFQRFWFGVKGKRERNSVIITNLALLAIALLMSATIGFKAYVLVQLPIIVLGTMAGVWLFYVQHQFEGVYWERHDQWDFVAAGLQGSSFYRLPKVLQWFSGNIGFHHIHHLNPRIPNYYLEPCHNATPLFQTVKPITLLSSFKSLSFRLWDEESRRLVGFGHLKTLPKTAPLPHNP